MARFTKGELRMDIKEISEQALVGIKIAVEEINKNKVYFKLTRKTLEIKSIGKINLDSDEAAKMCLKELTDLFKFKTDFDNQVKTKIWEYESRAGLY